MSATVDVSPVSGHDRLAVQNDRNLDDVQRTPIVSVHLRRHRQTFSLTRTSQNDSGQLQTTDGDITTRVLEDVAVHVATMSQGQLSDDHLI